MDTTTSAIAKLISRGRELASLLRPLQVSVFTVEAVDTLEAVTRERDEGLKMMMPSKFIQISTCAIEGQIWIYALDDDGNVFQFEGSGWRCLTPARIVDNGWTPSRPR